ncbi:MAG TPA: alcohol dehydrogenase catalytic domain-containing protein [Actinomycetota bacterium]
MRAIVYRGIGRVAVEDVPDPRVMEPSDAVVRVRLSAICASDLHFLHGKAPLHPGEGIGHEAVGVVEAVGSGVERFRPGDRVVPAFHIACGHCWFCERGQTQLCEDWRMLGAGLFGGELGGTQAELVRIPTADVNLLPVPDELDDERALFLGDVLTTGYYGAAIAGIGTGDTVAVVGTGPVGLFCVRSAALLGPQQVLALDMEPDRLALAERFGGAPIDVTRHHPHTAVSERTDGRGADVVIEAVGSPHGFATALDVVRRGGRITVVGMFTSETVPMQAGVWWTRALSVRFAGICPVHAYWESVLQEVLDGRLDPLPVVSHRLPLEDAPDGYELFASRRATKVLLRP